jgi:hypothetical protein
MKKINIKQIIRESIDKVLLNEDKTVTFGGQVDPKYGWAVIMCGPPGSGKSSAARNHLPIQGKIISSDYFREAYADMINTKNKDRVYDLKKSKDIMAIDSLVGYKNKNLYQKNLDNIKKGNTGKKYLPNLIFDTMGIKIGAFNNIINFIKSIGDYKISLVYVATNRNVAFVNNMSRDRTIPEGPFHSDTNIANGTSKKQDFQSISQLLKNYSDMIDEAWVIVNSSYDEENGTRIDRRTNSEEEKSNVVKLKKINGEFKIPDLFGTDERKPFLGGKKGVSLQDILGGKVDAGRFGRRNPENDEDLSSKVYPTINAAKTRAKEKGYPLKNTNVKFDQKAIDKRRKDQLSNWKQGKPGMSHSTLM